VVPSNIRKLGIFKKLSGWRAIPFAVAVAAFSLFFLLEGYFDLAGGGVLAIYAAMFLLCVFFSSRCSVDWNAALVVVSIALGGHMEFVGLFARI
jgi:hypothetical protein